MLKTWILSLMLTLQPKAPWADTYESTAESIATVVESEAPLFAGPSVDINADWPRPEDRATW